MSQDCEPQSGFEKSAGFYLEAANVALVSRQARLAMHLFQAAFETESAQLSVVTPSVVAGLRKAWDLALEIGDRSNAEAIFASLSQYNTSEENERAMERLHSLAIQQLEKIGITDKDLENVIDVVMPESDVADISEWLDAVKNELERIEQSRERLLGDDVVNKLMAKGQQTDSRLSLQADPKQGVGLTSARLPLASNNSANTESTKHLANHTENPDKKDESAALDAKTTFARHKTELSKLTNQLSKRLEERNNVHLEVKDSVLSYGSLIGYGRALEHMRRFGFSSGKDEKFVDFVEQMASMHGVAKLSLQGSFVFFGSSREDVEMFAHATAHEIGNPVLTVSVDLDKHGNGSIKLMGPFKRGFFGGPPDIMEMSTPCTVLIENIDMLQDIFDNEAKTLQRQPQAFKTSMGTAVRSMQTEVTTYLRVLCNKPGVFVMATAQKPGSLKETLTGLLSPVSEIEITRPNFDERCKVLASMALAHPSFIDLDYERLAKLSSGLSRADLYYASQTAVESAYRKSLRCGKYMKVTLGDIAQSIAANIDHESQNYKEAVNEAVAQLYQDIEDGVY